MPDTTAPQPPHPRSLADLFCSFTVLALQGFGGVAGVVQRELVERKRWLTQDEFIEDWAVAQIMPGPNVINLSLIVGSRYYGLPGALAALAGMVTVPLLVILALVAVHDRYANHAGVVGALKGMAAVSAGVLAAAGLKLSQALRRNALPLAWCLALCAAAFILLAIAQAPLAHVLAGVGGLGCWLAYRRLAPAAAEPDS
jgi:chromate transporter